MSRFQNKLCFVSMKFNVPWIDPVFDIIEKAAQEVGIQAFRDDRSVSPFSKLQVKLRDEIDRCLIFVCDASSFSWYVAFELSYALTRGKHVIVLIQTDRPRQRRDEGNLEAIVGNEYQIIRYSLASKLGREVLCQDLVDRMRVKLEAVAWDARLVRDILCRNDRVPSPERYVEPVVNWRDRDIPASKVWKEWLRYRGNQPIALVAPSGFGKSAFLARLKALLQDPGLRGVPPAKQPISPSSLPWWPLLVELGVEREAYRPHWFMSLYQRAVRSESVPSFPPESIEPYTMSGGGFLLLDGLDEFGLTRQEADLSSVVQECKQAAAQGLRVVVSCRRWFWRDRLTRDQREGFLVAKIRRFTEDQVQEFLGQRSWNDLKLTPDRSNQEWLYSPLVLTFVRDTDLSHVKTRTDIYQAWCDSILKETDSTATGRLDPKQMEAFLRELAYSAAKNRRQDLIREDWREAARVVLERSDFDPLVEPLPRLLIKRQDARGLRYLRFFHQSIHEFFLAMRLANDFTEALQRRPAEVRDLALSEAKLDYYAASVYGFLSERLGLQFLERLVDWFAKLSRQRSLKQYPPQLLRNLTEYIGMTFRGDYQKAGDFDLARTLLKVTGSRSFDPLVRYNAARALERIHPSSPRPYFDFAYDWGEASPLVASDRIPNAYTIRGVFKEYPVPALATMVVIPYQLADRFDKLRRQVVDDLLKTLASPAPQGCDGSVTATNDLSFLKINCSYALLRWFDFRDDNLQKRLFQVVAQSGMPPEAKGNLLRVPRAK